MTQPSQADHRRLATLAQTLAERRSASSASVTIKVAANGTAQPEVVVTPDTTQDDIARMTEYALASIIKIVEATAVKGA